jgi:hypothetical protein
VWCILGAVGQNTRPSMTTRSDTTAVSDVEKYKR